MKRNIYVTIFFGILSLNLFAQKNEKINGIYITGEELINGRASFIVDCNSRANKIRLNDFFNKPYVTVKRNDSTYKFFKKYIYGFRKCNNQVYRFNNKKELLLLNFGEEILIYHDILPGRTSAGRTNVTNYYFSAGINSPVQTLTMKNLKNAFPQNKEFHSLIDKNFKYNTDLANYDNINNIYEINWLLKQTIKNNYSAEKKIIRDNLKKSKN